MMQSLWYYLCKITYLLNPPSACVWATATAAVLIKTSRAEQHLLTGSSKTYPQLKLHRMCQPQLWGSLPSTLQLTALGPESGRIACACYSYAAKFFL